MQFASSCHCIIYENFVILDNVNVSLVHLIIISRIYVENAFNFFFLMKCIPVTVKIVCLS
jgi:hypothetical protein